MANILCFIVLAASLYAIAVNTSVSAAPAKDSTVCPKVKYQPPEYCQTVRVASNCTTDADCSPNKCCRQECGNYLCSKPACAPVLCDMYCVNGFARNENNCEICDCNSACPAVMCAENCVTGFAKDSNNCQTCQCNPAPTATA